MQPYPRAETYTIHIGALVGPGWEEWFDGAEIMTQPDGSTLMLTRIRDQAMLFGLLLRIRDLGLPLLGLYPGRLR